MAVHSIAPRLHDIVEAISRIRAVTGDMTLEAFEADWQARWIVERGVEIISEASRHLPEELKSRHPDIAWRKVAGIGNVLRHDYANIVAAVLWAVVRENLPHIEQVCHHELASLTR